MALYLGNTRYKPIVNGAKASFMIDESAPLPYDAEVEYLQSSGTQYINTGIGATNNTKIDVVLSDNTVDDRWVFGARKGYNNNQFGVFCTANAVNKWTVARANNTSAEFTFTTNSQFGISTFEINTSGFYGERGTYNYSVNVGSGTFNTNVPIYLFCMNNNGTRTYIASIRIYSCKIYESGVLVLYMIPVRVGQVGYMYDRVSGQLFGNKGTGSFILGNDKNT